MMRAKTYLWNLQVIRLFILVTIGTTNLTYGETQHKFNTSSAIYVIGDINGAYTQVSETLTRLDIIDTDGNWKADDTHIVSLGDLLGRETVSTKVMDLFMLLQRQAESAGGRFHILMGDQEIDYLISGFVHNTEGLSDKYRQWLLGLPFVVQINDQVFAHGGLSKKMAKLEIAELNHSLKTSLVEYLTNGNTISAADKPLNSGASSIQFEEIVKLYNIQQLTKSHETKDQLLFSNDNPVWYRGNVICHPYFETENLSLILNNWSANQLWVTHPTHSGHKLFSRLNRRLMVMDTSMGNAGKDTESWVAIIVKGNEPSFLNVYTKEQVPVKFLANRNKNNPYGMSEKEIEEFLKTAEVVEQKVLDIGVTKPIKMKLKKDDKIIKAIFKYVDSSPGKEKGSWKRESFEDDRFYYDMAAYKLDRMLNIGLVPVVVERTLDEKKGILQLWVDGLISKKTQKEQTISYQGHCNYKDQINLLDTFDYLISNNDRNKSNILYSKHDWQIWFIDHSRSFGLTTSRPRMMKKHTVKVTKDFKEALQSITRKKLFSLKPWLHRKQINAIWERRRKMLRGKF